MRMGAKGFGRVIGLLAATASALVAAMPPGDWQSYGRDVEGSRYSPLDQITPANVGTLGQAWAFELKPADAPDGRLRVSNMTPLAVDGVMFVPTPYGQLVALDGDTGEVRWVHSLADGDQVGGRALEYWPGDANSRPRIFFGTRSGKLMAVDPADGSPSRGFTPIDLRTPDVMNGVADGGYQINTSPVLYQDVLITGSKVQESPALGTRGDVRGWDARTGRLLWTFHSIPREGEPYHDTWQDGGWKNRSGVNVWTSMTVDQERGIAYLPFGAPAYDRIGIDRPGANLFSSSLVAVDARTGRYLWHYQTVHHDIWDLDLPTQPTLVDIRKGGRTIPAVVAINKSGYVFLLDRVTGKPIFPVKETPVPPSSLPGEKAWPTQPIPSAPPPLVRQKMTIADMARLTPEHRQFCLDRVKNEGASFAKPFEPLRADRPVIRFPGSGGGPNWGGGAWAPSLGYYFINVSELPSIEQMGQDAQGNWRNVGQGSSWFSMDGTKLPCQRPPWGTIAAVDVSRGTIAWQVPLGVTDGLPEGLRNTGRPNVGAPLATASGLLFIGATDDSRLRALDARTGRELWQAGLGASAHSTPITFTGKSGQQYVAIVAAGGSYLGSPPTASRLLVFALGAKGGIVRSVRSAASPATAPTPAPAAAAGQAGPQAAAAPSSAALAGFVPGPGQAIAARACTVCHVASQVTAQGRSRADWATTVEKMIGFGARISDAEAETLIGYLASAYPPAR